MGALPPEMTVRHAAPLGDRDGGLGETVVFVQDHPEAFLEPALEVHGERGHAANADANL